jgi:uncharacterized repeat protein (TIGR01451 family)
MSGIECRRIDCFVSERSTVMNSIKSKGSFLAKLGLSAGVLLFAQQAFSAGTAAGQDVDNLATITYEVNNVVQDVVESAPGVGNAVPGAGNGTITTFKVDNRVDFSLTQVGTAHTTVTPGETDAFVEFLLSNDGNSAQDFNLAVTDLVAGDVVNTLDDTNVNLANLRIRVGNGGGVPVLTDLPYGDEIAADTTVTVYVFGDADLILGLVNGDVANIELTATVAAAGTASSLGADLTDDILNPDTAGVEVVFAEGGVLGDGIESDRDGFLVSSAGLTVSKIATVISDPFNGATNPKAIPGAVVEYVITVSNGGASAADNVSIADAIDTDVAFDATFNGNTGLDIANGAASIACVADANAGDGCTLIGQDLTVGNVSLPITIVPTEALVITYRVTIP